MIAAAAARALLGAMRALRRLEWHMDGGRRGSRLGLARAVGVANWAPRHVEQLLAAGLAPPQV